MYSALASIICLFILLLFCFLCAKPIEKAPIRYVEDKDTEDDKKNKEKNKEKQKKKNDQIADIK